jgi:hypothetical protein
MASDNFNRADSGTLGSPWVDVAVGAWANGFQIVNNKAQPQTFGGNQLSYYAGAATGNDQYAEAVCADSPYITGVACRVKVVGGLLSAYGISTGSASGTFTLAFFGNAGGGTMTTLASVSPVAGDVIRLETTDTGGGNVLLKAFINGVQVGTNYTDTTFKYTGGQPGVFGSFVGFDDYDSWNGGDLGGSSTTYASHYFQSLIAGNIT